MLAQSSTECISVSLKYKLCRGLLLTHSIRIAAGYVLPNLRVTCCITLLSADISVDVHVSCMVLLVCDWGNCFSFLLTVEVLWSCGVAR